MKDSAKKPKSPTVPGALMGKIGGATGAAIGQIGAVSDVWGNISMSPDSRMNEEGEITHKVNTGANTLKMASSGASIGSAFGPWGTVIGGAAGAITGLAGSIIGNNNEPSIEDRLQRKNTFEMGQFTKRILSEDAIAKQQLMAEDGMDVQGGTKQIEVEKDELVLRKIGKMFRIVADFKGGDSHANGGEQYVAQQGDVIFPGKDRSKIKRMVDNRRWSAIESARMKLPIDTPKEQYVSGTSYIDPTKAPPTKRDTMDVQQYSKRKKAQLLSQGYKENTSYGGKYPFIHDENAKAFEQLKEDESNNVLRSIVGPDNNRTRGVYPAEFYQKPNPTNPNQYFNQESFKSMGVVNPSTDYLLFDKRIAPNVKTTYVNPATNDGVELYEYDFGHKYDKPPVKRGTGQVVRKAAPTKPKARTSLTGGRSPVSEGYQYAEGTQSVDTSKQSSWLDKY